MNHRYYTNKIKLEEWGTSHIIDDIGIRPNTVAFIDVRVVVLRKNEHLEEVHSYKATVIRTGYTGYIRYMHPTYEIMHKGHADTLNVSFDSKGLVIEVTNMYAGEAQFIVITNIEEEELL
ncbi:hypothetical protein E4H12_05325 [Candidatus Thorarchaeota archaeon]|nr:MAG: hypothetical protein E4H12_05325 [Candidatus Thorarchaeota archaeon]